MSDAPSTSYVRARRILLAKALEHLGPSLEAVGRKNDTVYVIVHPTRTSGNIEIYELAASSRQGTDYLRSIRKPLDLRSSEAAIKRIIKIGSNQPYDQVSVMSRGRPKSVTRLTEEILNELNAAFKSLRIDRR